MFLEARRLELGTGFEFVIILLLAMRNSRDLYEGLMFWLGVINSLVSHGKSQG